MGLSLSICHTGDFTFLVGQSLKNALDYKDLAGPAQCRLEEFLAERIN